MNRLLLGGALLLASCGSSDDVGAGDDPSKLSAELEARAAEIEKRADEAAAEVEKQAAEELAELEAEREAATDGEEDSPAGE